jgi:hypothetical protein
MKLKKPKKLQVLKKTKIKTPEKIYRKSNIKNNSIDCFSEIIDATRMTLESLINFVLNIEKRIFVLEEWLELLEKQQKEIKKKLDQKK